MFGFMKTWNKGSKTVWSQIQTGLTQIYRSRCWEAAFGDWDVGLEERRNLHNYVVGDFTSYLDFFAPDNSISNDRDYNFTLHKITLTMVELMVCENWCVTDKLFSPLSASTVAQLHTGSLSSGESWKRLGQPLAIDLHVMLTKCRCLKWFLSSVLCFASLSKAAVPTAVLAEWYMKYVCLHL